jgi:NAD(P)-dependent dehydrogenase (short-subunit alcohol dehydrogenase family)
VLLDRSPDVQSRADDLGSTGARVLARTCDLTDVDQTTAAADFVRERAGAGVQALIVLAGGFAVSGPVAESDPAVWHRQIDINATSAYLTTRAFLPLVRNARGSIVYFASAAALPGAKTANVSAYAVAKAGVLALMQTVAQEEKATGVRANALAPTAIRTASNVAAMGTDVSYVERETVADWVAFLCAPTSAVSGQVIRLG